MLGQPGLLLLLLLLLVELQLSCDDGATPLTRVKTLHLLALAGSNPCASMTSPLTVAWQFEEQLGLGLAASGAGRRLRRGNARRLFYAYYQRPVLKQLAEEHVDLTSHNFPIYDANHRHPPLCGRCTSSPGSRSARQMLTQQEAPNGTGRKAPRVCVDIPTPHFCACSTDKPLTSHFSNRSNEYERSGSLGRATQSAQVC